MKLKNIKNKIAYKNKLITIKDMNWDLSVEFWQQFDNKNR